MLISMIITGIVVVAIMNFARYSAFSVAGLANYASLNSGNREALDVLTREIREAMYVKTLDKTIITLVDTDGVDLEYRFDPARHALARTKNGTTKDLLTDCDDLRFTGYQLSPQTNSFDLATTTNAQQADVIRLNWTCSRTILGAKLNNEAVQSAKIVIRKNQLRP
jgi:hypothetical protein